MRYSCRSCPLRKQEFFAPMSGDEIQAMQRFKVGELAVEAGTPLLMEGSNSPQLFTALSGQGVRYKTLPNGRRQVITFVFPGDFLGLQAGVMAEMQHSAEATTDMLLCVFDRSELWTFFRTHPERGYDMTWLCAVEEHFLGEKLFAHAATVDCLDKSICSYTRFRPVTRKYVSFNTFRIARLYVS